MIRDISRSRRRLGLLLGSALSIAPACGQNAGSAGSGPADPAMGLGGAASASGGRGGGAASGGAVNGGTSTGARAGAAGSGATDSGTGGSAASPGAGGAPSNGGAPASGGTAGEGVAGTPAAGTANPGGSGACSASAAKGHFQMEDLNRGLVAVRTAAGNYVGWRMLGWEYDAEAPERIAYNLYRDGTLLAKVTDSTNYLDADAPASASYTVSALIDGVECAKSDATSAWAKDYLSIPLEPPPGGSTASGGYAYDTATMTRSSGSVTDGSPGDVDGDGEYEIFVIWDPSNSKDNSQEGHTGPAYLDCYKLDGKRLWRMNLGQNVRAGAHYTQFVVYDFDGDGRAEIALRTAPGTRDASGEFLSKGPAANDNDSMDYRNSSGYVLSGPEYLSVFDGATGLELATVNFEIARGNVSDWGDDYGNRVDRFLASAGFVSDGGSDGKGSGRPSILMARGYYTRATVSAWNYRDGELTRIWTADSKANGSAALAGQGAHSMVVADVDADDAQEIIYGAAMIQSNGSFGCSSGLGHGDALHAGDLDPERPGLEVFMPHEDESKETWDIRDAANCRVLRSSGVTGSDNGRGVAADIVSTSPGAELWSASDGNLRAASSGQSLGTKPSFVNFVLWWDADELRELEDGTSIRKGNGMELGGCSACMSNNNTKATPTLTADLFGDWREEIVWRTPNSSELRIFTSTAVTKRRLFTLMHDPQYRMQVSAEQTAYNQPPHPSFFLGDGMKNPPKPNLQLR